MGKPATRLDRRWWRTAAIAALLAISPISTASADLDGPRPITRETPEYPFAALRHGVEGWVVLEYTVNERGQVIKPRIIEATPPGVFDRAALKALSRWRYEARNAEPTTMKVKLTFRR